MNVVTTESAAFVLDATVVVIPIYPRGGRVRWLRFSATMYVFCGSCHPLHCSYTMCQNTATTPSQPVAQEINSVVPAPASKSSQGDVRDVQYFFDKQSAEKPFCKLCKYVFRPLTNSFFSQTKQKKLTGRYEMLTP